MESMSLNKQLNLLLLVRIFANCKKRNTCDIESVTEEARRQFEGRVAKVSWTENKQETFWCPMTLWE